MKVALGTIFKTDLYTGLEFNPKVRNHNVNVSLNVEIYLVSINTYLRTYDGYIWAGLKINKHNWVVPSCTLDHTVTLLSLKQGDHWVKSHSYPHVWCCLYLS